MIFSKQSPKHKGMSFVVAGIASALSRIFFILENLRNDATCNMEIKIRISPAERENHSTYFWEAILVSSVLESEPASLALRQYSTALSLSPSSMRISP
jgi:hypothetical protein